MRPIARTAAAILLLHAWGCYGPLLTSEDRVLADYASGKLTVETSLNNALDFRARLELPANLEHSNRCPRVATLQASLDGEALRPDPGGASEEWGSGGTGGGTKIHDVCEPVGFQDPEVFSHAVGPPLRPTEVTATFLLTSGGQAITLEVSRVFADRTLRRWNGEGVVHRGESVSLASPVATDQFVVDEKPFLMLDSSSFPIVAEGATEREVLFTVPLDAPLGPDDLFVDQVVVLPEITKCEGVGTCEVTIQVPAFRLHLEIVE